MTQNIVRHFEEAIRQARQHIEMDKALERLESSRDFKLVITEGYLEKEAIRLVRLKSDPAMQTPERKASVLAQIDAIGGLIQYFSTLNYNASLAEKSIEQLESEREEMTAEELQRG